MDKNQISIDHTSFLWEIFPTAQDITKCLGSLSKLERHFQQPITLTGSIATGWHLLRKGVRREKNPLNDIDTVVEGLSSVRTSLSQDFLINHFHPLRGKGRVLIQLVDAEYGTRIEVFTPNSETLTQRLTDFTVGDLSCRAVSIEDVFVKLLSIIYPLTQGETVDRKYVEHFDLLSTVADLEVAREVWRDYRKESQPTDFDGTTEVVRQSIEANPELLKSVEYSQNTQLICQWCCDSKFFPIADRNEIYSVLGYV